MLPSTVSARRGEGVIRGHGHRARRLPGARSTPAQVIAELDALYSLGWRGWVLFVDDNFIGNHRKALEMARELVSWQEQRGQPFSFCTETSIDLAERGELMDAMVEANFFFVFIGIETTSEASLKETKKFQNLRADPAFQVQVIRDHGLWVCAGFIIGFDSDDEGVFDRQRAFIDDAAIPWALINMLQAPPTTPLYERVRKQGRLLEPVTYSGLCAGPNFETAIPRDILIAGTSALVRDLYEPARFLRTTLASIERWMPHAGQRPPRLPVRYVLRTLLKSLWLQGLRSTYRREYWRYLGAAVWRFRSNVSRFVAASYMIMAGHHFITYARQLAGELDQERRTQLETRVRLTQRAVSSG
jgi:radical SAM superfamily enzyme YgiQ (UPF0313 family)